MYCYRLTGTDPHANHLVCPGLQINKVAADKITNVEVLPDCNLKSSRRTLRQKLFSLDHSPLQTGTHLQPARQRNVWKNRGVQCDEMVKTKRKPQNKFVQFNL